MAGTQLRRLPGHDRLAGRQPQVRGGGPRVQPRGRRRRPLHAHGPSARAPAGGPPQGGRVLPGGRHPLPVFQRRQEPTGHRLRHRQGAAGLNLCGGGLLD